MNILQKLLFEPTFGPSGLKRPHASEPDPLKMEFFNAVETMEALRWGRDHNEVIFRMAAQKRAKNSSSDNNLFSTQNPNQRRREDR